MARPIYYFYDIGDADADGISTSQTYTATGALTLDGALISGGVFYAQDTEVARDVPGGGQSIAGAMTRALQGQGQFPDTRHWARRVSFTSTGDDSGANFTITGENQDGFLITESVAGGTGTTATPAVTESVSYFRTITSISADATAAAALSVGTVDELQSPVILLDDHVGDGSRTNIIVNVTGTINYTVDQTVDNVRDPRFMFSTGKRGDLNSYPTIHWFALQAAGTSDSQNLATQGAGAVRITVNSYTNGAELDYKIIREYAD